MRRFARSCVRPTIFRKVFTLLSLLAFCVKHVCTKAGVFVFGAVGKADHAVSFFARLHENAFAAVLRRSRILFQAGISHFVKTLKTDADLPPAITGRKLA